MAIKTISYEEEFINALADPEEAAAYVNAARRDSRDSFFTALRDVAQARKMARVAEDANVERASLYRMLSPAGNPAFDTFVSVLDALGLDVEIKAKGSERTSATGGRSETENPSTGLSGLMEATANIDTMCLDATMQYIIQGGMSGNTISPQRTIMQPGFELPPITPKGFYGNDTN